MTDVTERANASLRRLGVAQFARERDGFEFAGSLGRVGPPTILRAHDDPGAWSLSGAYGHASFPWHTDGAVALRPPRWLLLRRVCATKDTYTEVCLPADDIVRMLACAILAVRNRSGRVKYLPAAVRVGADARLRWDTRVAQPTTPNLSEVISKLEPTSRISWSTTAVAIIDNHRVLHRRPAVESGVERLIERSHIWEA